MPCPGLPQAQARSAALAFARSGAMRDPASDHLPWHDLLAKETSDGSKRQLLDPLAQALAVELLLAMGVR